MANYKKCPRCDINWILDDENYCDICKAELNIGPKIDFDMDYDDSDEKLCPICKRNYIEEGDDDDYYDDDFDDEEDEKRRDDDDDFEIPEIDPQDFEEEDDEDEVDDDDDDED